VVTTIVLSVTIPSEAMVPPIFTLDVDAKFEPEIVRTVPPASGPRTTERDEMTGRTAEYVNAFVFVPDPSRPVAVTSTAADAGAMESATAVLMPSGSAHSTRGSCSSSSTTRFAVSVSTGVPSLSVDNPSSSGTPLTTTALVTSSAPGGFADDVTTTSSRYFTIMREIMLALRASEATEVPEIPTSFVEVGRGSLDDAAAAELQSEAVMASAITHPPNMCHRDLR
jgi:hypothetical protein